MFQINIQTPRVKVNQPDTYVTYSTVEKHSDVSTLLSLHFYREVLQYKRRWKIGKKRERERESERERQREREEEDGEFFWKESDKFGERRGDKTHRDIAAQISSELLL